MSEELTPMNHRELWLKAIATGTVPEWLEPMTHEELWLKAIAQGGGGLPPVTESDAGKVLGVNDSGVWVAQDNDVELNASISFGTQPYPITITSQLPSMSEIASWYENDRTILLRFPQNNWSIRLMPTSAESPSEESPIIYSWTSDAKGIDGDRMRVVVTFVQSGLSTLAFGGVLVGERYVVTLTPTAADYSGTMDKTVAEINAAYEAGQEIWFKVLTSASTSVEIPLTYWATITSYDYHGFEASLVDASANIMIVAYVGSTNYGTEQTYSTKLYPLTPAT